MKRRTTTSTPSSHKVTLKGVVEEVRKPAFFLLGMFAATQLGKLVDKQVTPAVSGLLGLDGETSKLIKPVAQIATGLVVARMTSNQDVKMVGYGAASAGGIILVKDLLKFDILPLSGADDVNDHIGTPGIGNTPNLPVLEGGYNQFTEGDQETFIEGVHYPEEVETPIS